MIGVLHHANPGFITQAVFEKIVTSDHKVIRFLYDFLKAPSHLLTIENLSLLIEDGVHAFSVLSIIDTLTYTNAKLQSYLALCVKFAESFQRARASMFPAAAPAAAASAEARLLPLYQTHRLALLSSDISSGPRPALTAPLRLLSMDALSEADIVPEEEWPFSGLEL